MKILSCIRNFFKQHPVSISFLISLLALYHASWLNHAYFSHVLLLLKLDNLQNILFFASMPIVVFCVLTIFFNLLIFPKLIKSVAIIFVLCGVALGYFMSNFNVLIDRTMIQNAAETTVAESTALLTPTLVYEVILLGIIPAILICLVRIKPVRSWLHYLGRRLLAIVLSIAVILVIGFMQYQNYASFMRNNKQVIKYLLPSNYIAAVINYYDYVKSKNLPFIVIGEDAKINAAAQASSKKNLVILVVGETSRAQNFSLGQYKRQTNPQLQKQDLFYFKNATSCGTATAYSVPCMFSNMAREDYDAKLAAHQSNVLDILKRVGTNVVWLENDSGCKGVCDRVTNVDVTKKYQANSQFCTDGECLDDVLLQELPQYLQNDDNNTLIVLHTIGSHGPTYYRRYTDKFKQFVPTCDTNEINKCDQQSLINTYDNTILYIDDFVNKTIEIAKQQSDRFNTAVIYLSDHGESLGENGIYLHSMPYSIAPDEQTHIPFLVWLSPAYKAANQIQKPCLSQLAETGEVSQDNLFHTLLGMFNVQTKQYQPKLDILQQCQAQ